MTNRMSASRFTAAVYMAAAASLGVLAATIPADSGVLSQRHSCGYQCNLDGSPATPAAPTVQQDADGDGIIDGTIEPAGRTNVHSGGRLHGSANKRVGCGGCGGHPASVTISGLWDGFQPMLHSSRDGRYTKRHGFGCGNRSC